MTRAVIVVLGLAVRMNAVRRAKFLTDTQRRGPADHCFLSAQKNTALRQAVGQALDERGGHADDWAPRTLSPKASGETKEALGSSRARRHLGREKVGGSGLQEHDVSNASVRLPGAATTRSNRSAARALPVLRARSCEMIATDRLVPAAMRRMKAKALKRYCRNEAQT